MKYLTKNIKTKDFWVEDYNNEQKNFFLKLGFIEEDNSHYPKEFKVPNALYFLGTGLFAGWTQQETKSIYKAVEKEYGKIKIELYIPE